jgi:hypothetical protein
MVMLVAANAIGVGAHAIGCLYEDSYRIRGDYMCLE